MNDWDLWWKMLLNLDKGVTCQALSKALGSKTGSLEFFACLGSKAKRNDLDPEMRRKVSLLASPFGKALLKIKLKELDESTK